MHPNLKGVLGYRIFANFWITIIYTDLEKSYQNLTKAIRRQICHKERIEKSIKKGSLLLLLRKTVKNYENFPTVTLRN